MNATQEFLRQRAVRNATEALARASVLSPDGRAIVLHEALMAATVALEAIGKLEEMKREKGHE